MTFVQSFSICHQRIASEGLSIAVEEDGNKMFTLLFAEDLLGNENSSFLQSFIRSSRHGAALVKAENDGIFNLYLHYLLHGLGQLFVVLLCHLSRELNWCFAVSDLKVTKFDLIV